MVGHHRGEARSWTIRDIPICEGTRKFLFLRKQVPWLHFAAQRNRQSLSHVAALAFLQRGTAMDLGDQPRYSRTRRTLYLRVIDANDPTRPANVRLPVQDWGAFKIGEDEKAWIYLDGFSKPLIPNLIWVPAERAISLVLRSYV